MGGLTRLLVIGGIVTAVASPACALSRAMPQPDRTLEWFVADSELIVRGAVLGVTQERVTNGNTFQAVTISVLETYKGDPPKGDSVTFIARNLDAGVARVRDEPADEYLFFLVRSAAHAESRPEAKELARAWKAAPWAMRDYFAVRPIPMGSMGNEPIYTFTEGLSRLDTGREVVDALRAWMVRAGGKSEGYRGEFRI